MKWTCENIEDIRKFLNPPYADDDGLSVYAILEVNCEHEAYDVVDIELTRRDINDIDGMIYDYFCCVHYKDNSDWNDGWESYECIEFGENEPRYFTTEEELKADMYKQLKRFCESKEDKIILTE